MKKLADLRGNMALRIMHGLTPSIMEDKPSAYSEASRLAYTLMSGAREIVYFGTRAVVRELRYCESNQILEQLSRIAPKDIDKILEFAVSAFANKKYWSDLFGGQGWSDFAKLLLTISQSLKQYSLAENYETKNKIANEISAYLNVVDGMMHNTGSFIDKMIQDETRQHNVSPNYTKQLEEATTLLNAKQLSNPEDILYIIEPYIRNTPEAYEFKELIAAYRSKGNIPDLNRIKRELDEINKHKQILRKYKEEWLPVFSEIMGETDPNKVSYYKTQMANIIRYTFDIDVRRQIEKFFIDTFKDSEKMRGYLIEQYLNNNYPTENVEVITDSGIDFYKWIGGKHQEVSFIDFPSPADVTVESADLPSGLGTINQLNELKQTAKTTDQKIRQFYGLG